jgi:hypothetical protein
VPRDREAASDRTEATPSSEPSKASAVPSGPTTGDAVSEAKPRVACTLKVVEIRPRVDEGMTMVLKGAVDGGMVVRRECPEKGE